MKVGDKIKLNSTGLDHIQDVSADKTYEVHEVDSDGFAKIITDAYTSYWVAPFMYKVVEPPGFIVEETIAPYNHEQVLEAHEAHMDIIKSNLPHLLYASVAWELGIDEDYMGGIKLKEDTLTAGEAKKVVEVLARFYGLIKE